MGNEVVREVALSVCELFFAEGWSAFTSEERHMVVDRMVAALRAVQIAAQEAACHDR